jgi:hypothetical protein
LESTFESFSSTDIVSDFHRKRRRANSIHPNILNSRLDQLAKRRRLEKNADADNDDDANDDDQMNTNPTRRRGRNTLIGPGIREAKPNQLNFYSPKIQALLMEAKAEYRMLISIECAFPAPEVKEEFSQRAFDIALELNPKIGAFSATRRAFYSKSIF